MALNLIQTGGLLRGWQAFKQTTTQTAVGKVTVDNIPAHGKKIVGYWLIGCAGMVFGAVVLGGVTRLVQLFVSSNKCDIYFVLMVNFKPD